MFVSYEIDHIISLKYRGDNDIENLAYACPNCNQHKGTDLATFLDSYENILTLFNPRKQSWNDHFYYDNEEIIALTNTDRVTIKVLNMNDIDLIILRQLLLISKRL